MIQNLCRKALICILDQKIWPKMMNWHDQCNLLLNDPGKTLKCYKRIWLCTKNLHFKPYCQSKIWTRRYSWKDFLKWRTAQVRLIMTTTYLSNVGLLWAKLRLQSSQKLAQNTQLNLHWARMRLHSTMTNLRQAHISPACPNVH